MLLYKTIKNESKIETIINKSRFIAYCRPVKSVEEANIFIEDIKKRNKDATHNVPVYLIGKKMDIQKYSDDGEPSGTAGVPILSMLKNEGITNVALVVTRYFGGIKLGTGGLVRAYTNSAKSALIASKIIDVSHYIRIKIILDYTLHGKILNYLSGIENVYINDTIYTDKVTMLIYIDKLDFEQITSNLIDITNSNIEICDKEDVEVEILDGVLYERGELNE